MVKRQYKDPPRYMAVSDWYEGAVKRKYKGMLKLMFKKLRDANPRRAK